MGKETILPSETAPNKRRGMPQVGLSTLLLLTACSAVWCGVWLAKREVSRLQAELIPSRALARELVITERTKLAIIRQDEMFYDENIWQIYVPKEGLQIHVATSGIDAQKDQQLPSEAQATLSSGTHTVQLTVLQQSEGWLVRVQVDLEAVIELQKPKHWNPNKGSSGGGGFDRQADFDPGQTAVMFRRRFTVDNAGKYEPHPDGNGVQLWIE
jgi:hypothetical protein